MNRNAFFVFTLITFLFFGCRESHRDRDSSTESAANQWMVSNAFHGIIKEIHKASVVDSIFNGVPIADAVAPSICVDSITYSPQNNPSAPLFPGSLILHYSETKTCPGERNRSGNIQITFSGLLNNVGTKLDVQLNNYMVDGLKITGNIQMEVVESTNYTSTYSVKISDGLVVNSKKTAKNISHYAANLNFKFSGGKASVTDTDDQFEIQGQGEGIAANGVIYTFQIEEVLLLDAMCNYEHVGWTRIKSDNSQDRLCIYNEGDGCDNIMLVAIEPEVGDIITTIP